MGNGRSSGMASQRRHSFRAHSKTYPENSGHFDVSCNAFDSWSCSRDRLSSSAAGPARNNDSVVLSPKLCHCVQHCALDHLSFLDEEVLRTYWRIPDDTEGIGGQLPCAQCLRRFPRTSDSSNCLSLKTVHESHVSLSTSSGSSPATSNNSAFSQHSNDSLERGLWSWTASLPGFVRQTLFHRTPLLWAPFHSVSVALTNTSP